MGVGAGNLELYNGIAWQQTAQDRNKLKIGEEALFLQSGAVSTQPSSKYVNVSTCGGVSSVITSFTTNRCTAKSENREILVVNIKIDMTDRE